MSVHVATGNALDVVFDYEDGRQVLKGLQRHRSDEVIPLPEPQGLIDVLQTVLNEIAVQEMKGATNGQTKHKG